MRIIRAFISLLLLFCVHLSFAQSDGWIRVNQAGYQPQNPKVAVFAVKNLVPEKEWQLVDAGTGKRVFKQKLPAGSGAYGALKNVYRLRFSAVKTASRYYIRCGKIRSPQFRIGNDVYKGGADFCLQYLRQQRSGYNPFLNDSCHTHDGYTLYGPMPDGTKVDVSGGWHDASDYLQYATTSANATYHLLAAYRDFKGVFLDTVLANGRPGNNGVSDVLDEARWGLNWLLKMHPKDDWLFNQIADDRDHQGMRLPTKDSVDYGYGRGLGRPVYFANGGVQGLGKYKNRATGVASIAGKFTSAFALASRIYAGEKDLADTFVHKAKTAYALGLAKPGTQQTAPNRAPYFYEEDNRTDDMELAAANLYRLTGEKKYAQQAEAYAAKEPVTAWMGADTARHYQFYPFHNFGHAELAARNAGLEKQKLISYYKQGIEKVWAKAARNGFYRGIPAIWCSNNLTVAFAIQCYLYRKLSGDEKYLELEQANFDWLMGVNPWGTSMIVGYPAGADTPQDPHSSFTHEFNLPINGGLVDGPVYESIFKSLKYVTLGKADSYAKFQSPAGVYHDDFADYSTNEPTMDGTAALVYLLAQKEHESGLKETKTIDRNGAIIRGDRSKKQIALVFTGHDFADGGTTIQSALSKQKVKASFFFTGDFYRAKQNAKLISALKKQGNYLGAHSDKHLLYCDWTKRDSLLVDSATFATDLQNCYKTMAAFGIKKSAARFFLPPYEWYNKTLSRWTLAEGLQLINLTPGTLSATDYTWPEMGKSYRSSKDIYQSILKVEKQPSGLNGFILLMHIGTDPKRKDKFYNRLDELILQLKKSGYGFTTVDRL